MFKTKNGQVVMVDEEIIDVVMEVAGAEPVDDNTWDLSGILISFEQAVRGFVEWATNTDSPVCNWCTGVMEPDFHYITGKEAEEILAYVIE